MSGESDRHVVRRGPLAGPAQDGRVESRLLGSPLDIHLHWLADRFGVRHVCLAGPSDHAGECVQLAQVPLGCGHFVPVERLCTVKEPSEHVELGALGDCAAELAVLHSVQLLDQERGRLTMLYQPSRHSVEVPIRLHL